MHAGESLILDPLNAPWSNQKVDRIIVWLGFEDQVKALRRKTVE
jgi:hypothetical protein